MFPWRNQDLGADFCSDSLKIKSHFPFVFLTTIYIFINLGNEVLQTVTIPLSLVGCMQNMGPVDLFYAQFCMEK